MLTPAQYARRHRAMKRDLEQLQEQLLNFVRTERIVAQTDDAHDHDLQVWRATTYEKLAFLIDAIRDGLERVEQHAERHQLANGR